MFASLALYLLQNSSGCHARPKFVNTKCALNCAPRPVLLKITCFTRTCFFQIIWFRDSIKFIFVSLKILAIYCSKFLNFFWSAPTMVGPPFRIHQRYIKKSDQINNPSSRNAPEGVLLICKSYEYHLRNFDLGPSRKIFPQRQCFDSNIWTHNK